MRSFIFGLAALAAFVSMLRGASAQTLQLPTFSFASVGTTVSVPDQGSVLLGGINRASEGRNEFGVPGLAIPGFQNRGIGREVSGSNMWVSATIHDFDAMDQALLGAPANDFAALTPSGLGNQGGMQAPQLAPVFHPEPVNLAGNWQPAAAAPSQVSKVAVEEAARDARRTARSAEADDYFARGRQAEEDGKPNVAKVFYQMALRRASGDVKKQVLARLDVVSGRAAAVANNAQ